MIRRTIAGALTLLALTGCVPPSYVRGEVAHTSHATAGWPVGPAYEEDGLTTAQVLLGWESRGWYLEAGVGVNLEGRDGGGFLGPTEVTTLRAGREIRFR